MEVPAEMEKARKPNGLEPRDSTRMTIIAGRTGVTFPTVIPVGTATIVVMDM